MLFTCQNVALANHNQRDFGACGRVRDGRTTALFAAPVLPLFLEEFPFKTSDHT